MPIDVLMPSVDPTMQTGRLTRWLRREGDFVEAGDPIAEIATDRATMDVEAPQSGVLSRILVEAGSLDVPVFQQIGLIEPRTDRAEVQAAAGRPARVSMSPRARRLAREAGLDLAQVNGSGPAGRVVERDVRAALDARTEGVQSWRGLQTWQGLQAQVETPRGQARPFLQSLVSAAQWTPQVHLEADCRLDALEIFRAALNAEARRNRTAKISLVDCVVKALALALQRAPRGNVAHAPDGFALARTSDIALALALDERIVAPALLAAEKLSLVEIAEARADFMAGRFSPAAYYGGVSMIANLGAFGVKRMLPAVLAPWTSVLAIGAAEKRVIVEDGEPEVATMLSVTLAIDRRAMDEMAGAVLLAAFKHLIENPKGLMI